VCVCVCVCVCVYRTSAVLSDPNAEVHLLRMTTYDLLMPISERTRCMKLTEIAGKLNITLGRGHTGLHTTNWICPWAEGTQDCSRQTGSEKWLSRLAPQELREGHEVRLMGVSVMHVMHYADEAENFMQYTVTHRIKYEFRTRRIT